MQNLGDRVRAQIDTMKISSITLLFYVRKQNAQKSVMLVHEVPLPVTQDPYWDVAAVLTLKANWFDTLTVKQWEIMINNDVLLFSATNEETP